jgi:hypothetical protein
MTARNVLDHLVHQSKKLDGALIYLETLEAQHDQVIGPRACAGCGSLQALVNV